MITWTRERRARVRAGAALLACLAGMVPPAAAAGDYLEIIPQFWRNLYPEGGTTLYCGTPFRPYDPRVNLEHVFPMAWVVRHLGCGDRDACRRTSAEFNRIESDMHNLYPALKAVNAARGAHPFAVIRGERWLRRDCDFEVDRQARRVEPRPAVRGDVARAMLYMAERHKLPLFSRHRRVLEAWHRDDPPDTAERRRNRIIERLQGNSNPFIEQRP